MSVGDLIWLLGQLNRAIKITVLPSLSIMISLVAMMHLVRQLILLLTNSCRNLFSKRQCPLISHCQGSSAGGSGGGRAGREAREGLHSHQRPFPYVQLIISCSLCLGQLT